MSDHSFSMPLAKAEAVAAIVAEELSPYCTAVHVAGSVRRRKPVVHDIDLVVCPHLRMSTGRKPRLVWAPEFLTKMQTCERWLLGNKHPSDTTKAFTVHSRKDGRLKIQIFACQPDQLGWILALRTGPEDFTTPLVSICKRRPIPHCFEDGWLWRMEGDEREKVLTPDEATLFRALQLPFIEVNDRYERKLMELHAATGGTKAEIRYRTY